MTFHIETRRSHAALDVETRRLKAKKIGRLLQLPDDRSIRMLEIGTGSGAIAHYFANHPDLDCDVVAVDVVDQRVASDGYRFAVVEDAELPFDTCEFDVIISNHVIEHVGDEDAQLIHLNEIRRVMGPHGFAYLATPNRWAVIEPHFQLAFLSWLPPASRSRYLRFRGRKEAYDCWPLGPRSLRSLIRSARLDAKHVETEAIRYAIDVGEWDGVMATIVGQIPDPVFRTLRPVVPTFVCLLTKDESEDQSRLR